MNEPPFRLPIDVEVTKEFETYFLAPVAEKSSFHAALHAIRRILSITVKSLLAGLTRPALPKTAIVVEANNLTKYGIIHAFLNQIGIEAGAVICPHPEDPQSKPLLEKLNDRAERLPPPPVRRFLAGCFGKMKWLASDPQSLIVWIEALSQQLTYQQLHRETGLRNWLCANEDTPASQVATQTLRALGVRTIDFMHGRAYRHRFFHEIFFVFNRASRDFLQPYQGSTARFVVWSRFSVQPPAVDLRARTQIVIWDQSTFAWLSEKERNAFFDVVRKLKAAFPSLEFVLKPHPRAMEMLKSMDLSVFNRIEIRPDLSIILANAKLSLSCFSTSAVDSVSHGVPAVVLNWENRIRDFRQLAFLEANSPQTPDEMVETVSRLLSDADALDRHRDDLLKRYREDFDPDLDGQELKNLLLT